MNIEDRKKYRLVLLRRVYNNYFDNNGASLVVDNDELQEEPEKKLAYDYLVNSGLLTRSNQGRTYLYSPTVAGINMVESLK